MTVSYFDENVRGRDFVVGDIHGSFEMVKRAMQAIWFDGSKDRLFCVGDLIDRGKESHEVLDFLALPGVHSILGNHEEMMLDLYDGCDFTAKKPPLSDAILARFTQHNGMQWWTEQSQELRERIIRAFRQLPMAIEIESARGTVGLVHAEVPIGMDWHTFKLNIASGCKDTQRSALWGRNRIKPKRIGEITPPQYDGGVVGIDRIFCGHTIQDRPVKLGNVYFVDTGAVFRDICADQQSRLTIVNMVIKTGVIVHKVPPEDDIDVRTMSETPSLPFGVYAK